MWWEYISHYGRGGDLTSLNEEIQPSVVYFWCESPLGSLYLQLFHPFQKQDVKG